MLILEVAVGVLLGLLLYRGLDTFCKQRNLTMPAGIFALGFSMVVIAIPISVLVFFGPYVYKYVENRVKPPDKIRLSNDLPPDPPGYFWIRTDHRPNAEDQNAPLLRGGHCERECDSDHPLWLVPRSK